MVCDMLLVTLGILSSLHNANNCHYFPWSYRTNDEEDCSEVCLTTLEWTARRLKQGYPVRLLHFLCESCRQDPAEEHINLSKVVVYNFPEEHDGWPKSNPVLKNSRGSFPELGIWPSTGHDQVTLACSSQVLAAEAPLVTD